MLYYSEAKYTEVLKNILYDFLDEDKIKNMNVNQICEEAAPHIFDSEIPFFDEEYRIPLEKKILLHYYTREIGAETEERFIYFLNRTLIEEMPYFNQLYQSELLEFDPLKNYLQDEQKISAENNDSKTVSIDGESKNYNEGNIEQEKISNQNTNIARRSQDEQNNSVSQDNISGSNKSKSLSVNNNNNQEDISGEPTTHDETESATNSISGMLDTPQGALTGLDRAISALDGNTTGSPYLTSGSAAKSESEGTADKKEHLDQHTTTNGGTNNVQIDDGLDQSNANNITIDNNKTLDNETTIGNEQEIKDNIREKTGKDAIKRNSAKSGKEKNTESYILKIAGMRGYTPSEMLIKFRETFLNIDKMVIDSVADCFMGVY